MSDQEKERQRAIEALARSEEQFRNLIEQGPESIVIFAPMFQVGCLSAFSFVAARIWSIWSALTPASRATRSQSPVLTLVTTLATRESQA
jgi:hypothetical protein